MHVSSTLAALTVALAACAAAQDTPPPPPMDDATMKYIEASTPNANHKKLTPLLGGWNAESSFWIEGPDKPPATGNGLMKISWTFDGRFLRQEFNGVFLQMPMQGLGFTGYDNLKKTYTMFWIDNTATGMATAEGKFDAAGTTLTLKGKYDDPYTGEKNKSVKYVIRMPEGDKWTYEMYDVPAKGADVLIGRIVYARLQEYR
jgi:hypothetical protein